MTDIENKTSYLIETPAEPQAPLACGRAGVVADRLERLIRKKRLVNGHDLQQEYDISLIDALVQGGWPWPDKNPLFADDYNRIVYKRLSGKPHLNAQYRINCAAIVLLEAGHEETMCEALHLGSEEVHHLPTVTVRPPSLRQWMRDQRDMFLLDIDEAKTIRENVHGMRLIKQNRYNYREKKKRLPEDKLPRVQQKQALENS